MSNGMKDLKARTSTGGGWGRSSETAVRRVSGGPQEPAADQSAGAPVAPAADEAAAVPEPPAAPTPAATPVAAPVSAPPVRAVAAPTVIAETASRRRGKAAGYRRLALPRKATPESAQPVKMVIYVRPEQWEFLREQQRMSTEGNRRRKEVSQSELIRFALDRLMESTR